ncbi:monooxygenase 2-like [Rosa rugosa]|uniref:monooxygenase 2-like n=1 Tax=Rosa rugosa TaxID=74645 RepID=UPI002B408620|nr:monooxygenase 2-like [Rosa rugosa]
MEVVEEIVIVGAGIAGLTTSLGLHRLGIRSLVLETSESLRTTGFAFSTWTNAWKALDAIGIGESLRRQHETLHRNVTYSTVSGLPVFEMSLKDKGKQGDHEVRCVQRKLLLEALANELPSGTIRFSSKVVSIEESGYFKLLHLADGTILKAKVLVGCDGVNSVVAKWLGFKPPAFTGRHGIRGRANYKNSHGFDPNFMQFFGNGVRSGAIPCDDKTVYWFFTWTPTNQEKELEKNPAEMKQFMLSKLGNIPDEIKAVIKNTELDAFVSSPLRFRHPWELLWGNISKGNVCVAGDALHPMTPDLVQGGCSAIEDGVVLARCLGEALLKNSRQEMKGKSEQGNEEYKKIEMGLNKFANERRWRGFDLISTGYMVALMQGSEGKMMSTLNKYLAPILARWLLQKADFDCGKLSSI